MAKDVIGGLIRREPGVDLIALIAMVSALLLGEYLAGAVIALMLASGEALEAYADRRAHKELSSLLARAPRTVTRYEDGDLATRPIEEVVPGDLLLVKTGEVVPVDGLMAGDGVLDESALTGESRPVERPHGDLVRSGAVNAGAAFDLRATASAEESTYAGIVRLVEVSTGGEGAGGAAGRPLRDDLHPGDAGDRGRGMGPHGRPDPVPLGRGGRDPVPADPRGADRDRSRHLAVGQAGHHREGRRRARDARPRLGPAVRQDRHAHLGDPAGRRRRDVRGDPGRAPAAPRGLARPGVAARAGRRDRPRGAGSRPRADLPRRGEREARRRHRGQRRRSSGRPREGVVRDRRGPAAAARAGRAASHDARRFVVRVRGGRRRGRRRPGDRRPDPARHAAGDPVPAARRASGAWSW